MSYTAPFPLRDPIARRDTMAVTLPWINWFTSLQQDVQEAPFRVATVTVINQSASIGTTPLPVGTLAAGLYRVTYLSRITTAATTSSSLTVLVGFTVDGGTALFTGSAMTDNTVGACRSQTFLLRIDASTPIVYYTTYSSTGASAMRYALDLTVEQVDA